VRPQILSRLRVDPIREGRAVCNENCAKSAIGERSETLKDVKSEAGSSGQGKSMSRLTRRDILKQAVMAGAILPQRFGDRGRGRFGRAIDPSQIPPYQYRTLPVSRFPELQSEYDRTRNVESLTRNKAFRDQISPLSFKLPADFSNAKSVVVIAAFAKSMYVNFTLDGTPFRVLVPPQYYMDGLNAANLKGIVQNEILKDANRRVVDFTTRVPLKLLAGHSGLGRYGRNNLIFVDGMGSYNLLYAFLTDYQFPEDNWTGLNVLEHCQRCDHCDRICPTACISRSNFGINIDKCLTLYNENPGDFPNWILRSSHHALMGCVRCQEPCPVNRGIAEISGTLEDISEEETRKILKGAPDDMLLKNLQRKLKQFPATKSKETFPILTRNFSILAKS
jgi:epoxyqueuosine reductase